MAENIAENTYTIKVDTETSHQNTAFSGRLQSFISQVTDTPVNIISAVGMVSPDDDIVLENFEIHREPLQSGDGEYIIGKATNPLTIHFEFNQAQKISSAGTANFQSGDFMVLGLPSDSFEDTDTMSIAHIIAEL